MKLIDRYRKLTFWNKIAFWGSMASVFAIPFALILFFFSINKSQPDISNYKVYTEPYSIKIDDNYFEVLTKLKNILWSHTVSGKISKTMIIDITGNGKNEVILGVKGNGKDSGKIIAFNNAGKILWEFINTNNFNYSGGTSGEMIVTNFEVADLYSNGEKQIVSLFIDSQGWYQSCITIINDEGELISKYWNPGHLYHLKIGAENDNRNNKIAVGGLNNDLRSRFPGKGNIYSFFLLDPLDVKGEAPPYYGISNSGSQLWYGVILPKESGLTQLDIIDSNNDGIKEISIWTNIGHQFLISFSGEVISHRMGDAAEKKATIYFVD